MSRPPARAACASASGRLAAAHSAEPRNAALRAIGHGLEKALWRFPSVTMGCRPVRTLPALVAAGAKVELETTIGVPIFPFAVYVVTKPAP